MGDAEARTQCHSKFSIIIDSGHHWSTRKSQHSWNHVKSLHLDNDHCNHDAQILLLAFVSMIQDDQMTFDAEALRTREDVIYVVPTAFIVMMWCVTIIDVVDAVLDCVLAVDLCITENPLYGMWMFIMTAIAVSTATAIKRHLRRKRAPRPAFVFVHGTIAIFKFLLEDVTTLMVWLVTGVFDGDSGWSLANLIFTLISSLIMILGVMVSVYGRGDEHGGMYGACCSLFFGLPALLFWGWIALGVIVGGQSRTNTGVIVGAILMYVLGCCCAFIQAKSTFLVLSNLPDKKQ